jgi:glycosyltransferase involved in cell wall biosynthesis
LERVIESLKGFDEVLVCDMESTDHTIDIARRMGCRVITFPKENHSIVEPAREFAIHEAHYEWVLVIDADELVPAQLRNYLYEQIESDNCPDGIAIPRKNYFMGRFLHSAYPDYVLRFFRRDKTHWPAVIHCSPEIDGRVVRIPKGRRDLALNHLANDTVSDILRKADTYSTYELPRRRKKNYGLWALLSRPLFRFVKSYFLKRGFLDGMPGLIHALLDAHYQAAVVEKLIEERQ